jgi:hypothetical protein
MRFPTYRGQVKSSRRGFHEKDRKHFYRNVYLKSDHWKNLREEKLEQVTACETCKTTCSLDVHHDNYRGLYDVRLTDLRVLCRKCHDDEHTKKSSQTKLQKRESRRLRRENCQYVHFPLSKDPIIRYLLIMWAYRIVVKLRSRPCYPKNVRRSLNWQNFNTNLRTDLYARSKIYNSSWKNLKH